MHPFITRFAALGAFLCIVSLGMACGKKEEPEAPAAVTENPDAAAEIPGGLPGEAAIYAALDAADYRTAVATLAKLGRTTPPDKRVDFLVLQREVNMRLLQDSATDPKAKEALEALRIMSMGR